MTSEVNYSDSEELGPWGTPEVVDLFGQFAERHKGVRTDSTWEENMKQYVLSIEDNPSLRYEVANEILDHRNDPFAVVAACPVFDFLSIGIVGQQYGIAKINPETGIVHQDTYDWAITEVDGCVIETNTFYEPLHIDLMLEQREAQRQLGLDPEL